MNTIKNWITIGRFSKPYGVKGYIKVQSFTDPLDNIFHYKNWCILNNRQQHQTITVSTLKYHGSILVAQVDEYPTRESLAGLAGKDIIIDRVQLPELQLGEYYWSDLIGLQVIDTRNKILGKVIEIIETGANDVLIVKGDKEHLIPYLPDRVIKDINLVNQTILVDWDSDF